MSRTVQESSKSHAKVQERSKSHAKVQESSKSHVKVDERSSELDLIAEVQANCSFKKSAALIQLHEDTSEIYRSLEELTEDCRRALETVRAKDSLVPQEGASSR